MLLLEGSICSENKALNFFCDDSICNMGNKCESRLTPVGNYELVVQNEMHLGIGLMLGSIGIEKENEYIGEYTGRIRSNNYNLKGTPPLYTMRLSKRYMVEAKDSSNVLKFINHSCNPNTKSEIWYSEGKYNEFLICNHGPG
jgi:histone-lysine N-methyltransferase SETD2